MQVSAVVFSLKKSGMAASLSPIVYSLWGDQISLIVQTKHISVSQAKKCTDMSLWFGKSKLHMILDLQGATYLTTLKRKTSPL